MAVSKPYNLAWVSTATTGTGTLTLGTAVTGYLTFAQANVQDGDVVDYTIHDGANSESGQGTYTASGTTLSRTTVRRSTGAGNTGLISCSGSATVSIEPSAESFGSKLEASNNLSDLTNIATALSNLGLTSLLPTTGDVKLTFKTVADSGWVLFDDGSIGDASSGASTRANADTVNLFTLFYNNCADADVPVQTSAGGATTRGAQGTAAAAFAAHCRIVLPKMLGRALAGAGAGSGLTARGLGSKTGTETFTQTINELVSHNHPLLIAQGGGLFGNGASGSIGTGTAFGLVTTTIGNNGSGNPSPIVQPTAFLNVMVKL